MQTEGIHKWEVLSEGWPALHVHVQPVFVSAVMLMSLTRPLNNYGISVTLCNVKLPFKHINTLSCGFT